jgi:CRP-like cAMP-binding protein
MGLTKTTFSPAVTEDLLSGMQRLHGAFLEGESRSLEAGAMVNTDQSDPPAFLIRRGFAYSAMTLADGRRAITDIHLAGDIVGIENVEMGRTSHAVVAANDLHFHPLSAAVIRNLMADPQVAVSMLALAGESRRRAERHMVGLARLDARERLCAFLLGIYERLWQRQRITRPTFTLALTQAEIADHLGLTMVHVSRTLRRMREEKLVIVNRRVVILLDVDDLRAAAGPTSDMIQGSGQSKADSKAGGHRTGEAFIPTLTGPPRTFPPTHSLASASPHPLRQR